MEGYRCASGGVTVCIGTDHGKTQGGFENPFVAADVSRRKRVGIGLNNAPTDVGGYERVLESVLGKTKHRTFWVSCCGGCA